MSGSDENNKQPKPSGRVRHDKTGRAIWEWAADSGRHAIESTSRLLKRLELPGLSLADDDKDKQEEEEPENREDQGRNPYERENPDKVPTFGGPRETDPLAGSRRNFDPYNNKAPKKAAAPKPPGKLAPRITQPVRPAAKPGLFARLFGRGR